MHRAEGTACGTEVCAIGNAVAGIGKCFGGDGSFDETAAFTNLGTCP